MNVNKGHKTKSKPSHPSQGRFPAYNEEIKQITVFQFPKINEILHTNEDPHIFFIRNHFMSNLVLDNLKFKKLLELQGKELSNFRKIAHCFGILLILTHFICIGQIVCYIHVLRTHAFTTMQFATLRNF